MNTVYTEKGNTSLTFTGKSEVNRVTNDASKEIALIILNVIHPQEILCNMNNVFSNEFSKILIFDINNSEKTSIPNFHQNIIFDPPCYNGINNYYHIFDLTKKHDNVCGAETNRLFEEIITIDIIILFHCKTNSHFDNLVKFSILLLKVLIF